MKRSEKGYGTGQPKRAKRKRPKNKPKRPLSAYNYFFKEERARILRIALKQGSDDENVPSSNDYVDDETIAKLQTEDGKISFEEMGRLVGVRWKNISPDRLEMYKGFAAEDATRYKTEMANYTTQEEARTHKERQAMQQKQEEEEAEKAIEYKPYPNFAPHQAPSHHLGNPNDPHHEHGYGGAYPGANPGYYPHPANEPYPGYHPNVPDQDQIYGRHQHAHASRVPESEPPYPVMENGHPYTPYGYNAYPYAPGGGNSSAGPPLGNSERYGGWDPRNPGAPETGHYSFPPRSYMAAEHGNNDAYPQDRGLRNDGGNPKHAMKDDFFGERSSIDHDAAHHHRQLSEPKKGERGLPQSHQDRQATTGSSEKEMFQPNLDPSYDQRRNTYLHDGHLPQRENMGGQGEWVG